MIDKFQSNNPKTTSILIDVGDAQLSGDLIFAESAKGIVIFAHGSGSSRFSSRNRFVASVLNEHKMVALLVDLLTDREEEIDERTRELRFDIPLLARRLVRLGEWAHGEPQLSDKKIGYFGSSTGGAAALVAAAEQNELIAAVVSRGGRPDLAMDVLSEVKAPTLLIVGERDAEVLALNIKALSLLNKQSRLEIIPGATHLFEEKGALEMVALKAEKWFEEKMCQ